MSKNELIVKKIFQGDISIPYKERIQIVQDHMISIADNKNIFGNGKEIIHPPILKYKHSFAEGLYLREMKMKKGQLGFSAIHKHSYGFFLLSGLLQSSKEDGVEEFIAPCYIISPQGAKRIVYAAEDCVIVTVHANPTNTQDLDELAKINVVFDWDDYEEYLKSKK